jgi:RHS repeat-associated protein
MNNRIEGEYSGGSLAKEFVHATGDLAADYMIVGSTKYRLIKDHLGSVRFVVNVNDGTVAQRLDYNEWGKVLKDSNSCFQPFGFAGGTYDEATGLVRFGARDYDPEIGRWTSKDPVRFAAGDTNLYGYVVSDPVNFIDQTGLTLSDVNWRNVFGGAALVGTGYGAVIGGASLIGSGIGAPLGLVGTAIGTGGILSGIVLLATEVDNFRKDPSTGFGANAPKQQYTCSMR